MRSLSQTDEFICEDLEVYINDWHNPLFAADDLHINDAIKNLDSWEWFKKKEEPEDFEDYDDFEDYEEFEGYEGFEDDEDDDWDEED